MNVKVILSKAGLVLKQASPEILTAGGIILGVAALITACSKMKEAEAATEENHAELEEEQTRYENEEEPDRKKHVANCIKIGGKSAWRYLKVFWIPLLLEILSIVAIWYSHGIMVKRNAALASTAMVLTQQLENYRERVRDKVGEEAENDLFYGLTNKKIGTQIEMGEDGKTKKVPIYQKLVETGAGGPFDFIFDRTNPNYQHTPGNNMSVLKLIQRECQDIMQSRATDYSKGYFMVNELYQHFGKNPPAESFGWGWFWDKHDPRLEDVIDFGINDFSNQIVRDFANGLEPVIPLHFNCHPLNPMTDLGLVKGFAA